MQLVGFPGLTPRPDVFEALPWSGRQRMRLLEICRALQSAVALKSWLAALVLA